MKKRRYSRFIWYEISRSLFTTGIQILCKICLRGRDFNFISECKQWKKLFIYKALLGDFNNIRKKLLNYSLCNPLFN